jgi:hypothetical protein
MNGSNLAAMHKPLERPWMNLEDGRRLMTVEQWLAVYSGAAIWCPCTCRWLLFIGHGDSLLQSNLALLLHQRDSRSSALPSNNFSGDRYSIQE